ncbi:MAG: GNAT family N-acetyltransferase [Myxococcota bacterium]
MIQLGPAQLRWAHQIDRLFASVQDALIPPGARLESIAERMADPGRILRVARKGETLLGALDGRIEGDRGSIAQLAVAQDVRFRGVGKALVEAFASEARSEGARLLEAWVIDPESEGFWLSMSFERDPDGAYRRT